MLKRLIIYLIIAIGVSSCSGFSPFDYESSIKIFINEEKQVVMGEENWTGPQDCSSHAYLNRTPASLLFTIEVFDDSIKTGEPQSYMNDGVELYFDFRPPRLRRKNVYEKGVFQAVILPEPGKKQLAPIQWFPGSYENAVPGTRAYTELRDSGYVLQVSIPYSGLKRLHFWPRKKFYLDVAINDADTGARESQLMWRGKNDNWNNPHNFAPVSFSEKEKRTADRPNFLLVFTDQQTIEAMSAMGNPYLNTPNMDALARFGTLFTESYCTSPVCSPARSSMIMGRMPHETGVNYNDQAPDSGLRNMGEYFRDAGYTTLWAGKWHLPESYPPPTALEVPGFKLIQFSHDQQVSPRGDVSDEPLADAAVKYLKGRKQQPFLLVVSFTNPHDICYLPINPEGFIPPLNIEATPPLPRNHRIPAGEPEFVKDSRTRTAYENEVAFTTEYTAEDWRNYLFHYYRMVERVDRQIGKLISALESEGLDENTIIIFTSDHGEGASSHKWATKLSLYEESVKVPFILTKFKHDGEAVVDSEHLVSGLDILPTMMDYAGIEIPSKMRGVSLKTIIEKPDTILRDYLITELAIDPEDTGMTGRMITDGNYKYIVYSYGQNPEQLFNLQNDPGEMTDLSEYENYGNIKRNLRKKLREWMDETGDGFRGNW